MVSHVTFQKRLLSDNWHQLMTDVCMFFSTFVLSGQDNLYYMISCCSCYNISEIPLAF